MDVERCGMGIDLDVARPPVEVQMKALDRTKVAEELIQVFLRRFLVHVRNRNDPSFDRYEAHKEQSGQVSFIRSTC